MRFEGIPERLRHGIGRRLRRQAVPAVIIAGLLAVSIGTMISLLGSSGGSQTISGSESTAQPTLGDGSPGGSSFGTLYVHVSGAVVRPGLVTVSVGARLVDAIAAAGGFTAEADQSAVNLARAVNDGEHIVVPVLGAAAGTSGTGNGTDVGALINLNTADQAALETLPRVGPAMAARIIAWREANGGFRSVDDLKQVTGIGEKTFAELAPLVTV
ncbi:MAG: helix-hairpin-helix domain-containing protein [Microbacteriaceae bacterium]